MMIYTVDGPRQVQHDKYEKVKSSLKTAWTKNNNKNIANKSEQRATENQGPGIPGFHYFTRAEKSIGKRRFWLSVYIACISLCVIQMSERLNYFLTYPMVMTLTAERTTAWKYPDITICPFHGFKSGRILDAVERLCPPDTPKYDCPDFYDLLDYENKNITKLWDMTGDDLSKTLVECNYGGNFSCDEPEYWKLERTLMGECYTLSIPHRIVHGGPWVGVNILLKEPRHMAGIDLNHLRWKALLHENNTVLAYSSLTRSTMTYIQTNTILMFSKKEYYYESTPIRPCTSKEIVRDCLSVCFDLKFLRNYKCRLPFMYTLKDVPFCTDSSIFRSMYKVPVHNNDFQDNVDSCKCGRACHEIVYELLPDSMKEDRPRHDRMIVYPTQPGTEIVRERRAYPATSLISDLGGALGLYLGVCILTFMETIQFVIKSFFGRKQSL